MPLAYLVAGIFIIPAMIAIAELAAAMPRAGGAYFFLDRALGPLVGTVGGLGTWLALVLKSAFASTGKAGILSASRYPLATARDHLVSPRFAILGRFHTPTLSIVATAGLMAAAILFLDIASIAKLASAFQLLLFSLLSLAVMIMREARIEGYDPGFRSPLYPWIHIFGFLAPFWLIAEMGPMAVLFTLGLVAVTVVWYFQYAHARVERTGAIFHTFARLGERRHGALDMELRGIVREKGLREEDPFDEVVARARVLDLDAPVGLEEVVVRASKALAERLGASEEALTEEFMEEVTAGFVPVAAGAALPHVRLPGLEHPELLLVRLRDGRTAPDPAGPELAPGSHEGLRAMFFLVSPEEEPGQHLRLLGHLATHVDDPEFLGLWLEAENELDLRESLLCGERSLTVWVRTDRASGAWIGRAIRDIDLPDDTLVALIRRDGAGLVPNGASIVQDDDHLVIIGNPGPIARLAREGVRTAVLVLEGPARTVTPTNRPNLLRSGTISEHSVAIPPRHPRNHG